LLKKKEMRCSKRIIQYILKSLAKAILKKYQPDVIGITGSVGKTSAKMAIQTVLKNDFKVRASQKSYNTETGVPLTIIGSGNPGRNIFGWLAVILKALALIFARDKNYPQILILEMAADHQGDIKYLTDIAQPKIGLITSVGPTHLEFFGSVANVAKEKSIMIANLNTTDYAVINNDQKILVELSKKTKAQLFTYGLNKADLTASDLELNQASGGLYFKINYKDNSANVNLPNLLGRPIVYAFLAASAVGIIYQLNLKKIAERLEDFENQPGRLNLLPGIKYTRIIDDSYNSSPLAVKAALETLSQLKCAGNKFAVLGDMLELGDYTKKAHQEIGELVAKLAIDYLITVGERSHSTAESAKEFGMNPDRIFSFDNPENAGCFLQDRIAEGDLILVKGSAAMSMERITKEIMAEPQKANKLLVRQK